MFFVTGFCFYAFFFGAAFFAGAFFATVFFAALGFASAAEAFDFAPRPRPPFVPFFAAASASSARASSIVSASGSVDFVVCSNFLHHLDEREALAALAEMRRVAARGVVAVDLQRSDGAWLNVWLLTRLSTRNRLTRSDGPLSVRRAWTLPEARALLAEAGLRPVATVVGFAGHRWAIAAVRS